jgi:hypothetical protein
MSNPDVLRTFGESAEALEARIADAQARGVAVPAEAHAMLVSLRELSQAIASLQASLGDEAAEEPSSPAGDPAPPAAS